MALTLLLLTVSLPLTRGASGQSGRVVVVTRGTEVGLWVPRGLGEDYHDLVTRVLPLRDEMLATQEQIIARLETVRASQEARIEVQSRMIADLEAMLVSYTEEVELRQRVEDNLQKHIRRNRIWKGVSIFLGAVAIGAILD